MKFSKNDGKGSWKSFKKSELYEFSIVQLESLVQIYEQSKKYSTPKW